MQRILPGKMVKQGSCTNRLYWDKKFHIKRRQRLQRKMAAMTLKPNFLPNSRIKTYSVKMQLEILHWVKKNFFPREPLGSSVMK